MNSQILNNPYYNYYTVNNIQYPTKLFAKIASELMEDKYPVLWSLPHFENALNTLNLLQEPEESISSLYLKRAEQLRNDYDYLILLYSGGSDSHNILETFMFNGIFIDEILILDQFDRSFRAKLEDQNFEFLHLSAYEAQLCAIPLAQYFIDTYSPKTKLTVVDNSFSIHAHYWINLQEKTMYENLKSSGTLGMIGKTPVRIKDLSLYNSAWKKTKESKKVAHIWGRDKVVVRYDDTGFFISFVDSTFTDYLEVYNQLTIEDLPQDIEFFYTHPTTVKIIIKQAHLIMNKLPFYKINPKIITRKYENLLADIIYDRKIPAPYLGLKAGDFENWNKYLYSKDVSKNVLPIYNMAELVLLKNLDNAVTDSFQKQTTIISQLLKCKEDEVEGKLSQNYSVKRYYIKYFD
jgi:hypothetical protein